MITSAHSAAACRFAQIAHSFTDVTVFQFLLALDVDDPFFSFFGLIDFIFFFSVSCGCFL